MLHKPRAVWLSFYLGGDKGMNLGTKLRTILVVATCLNTALIAMDVTWISNAYVDFAYKIVSMILNFVIVAISTYYNNDYTPEAQAGTNLARLMKENSDIDMLMEMEPEDAEVFDNGNW